MNSVAKTLLVASTALVIAGGTALGKLAPYTPDRPTAVAAAASADASLNQPLGAMRESHYFNAPAASSGSRVFRCRSNVSLFDKATLTRTC